MTGLAWFNAPELLLLAGLWFGWAWRWHRRRPQERVRGEGLAALRRVCERRQR